MRYPGVPDAEMKKVKEKFDSSSQYALCLCTQRTLLLVGSEKIPACYHWINSKIHTVVDLALFEQSLNANCEQQARIWAFWG